MAYVGLMPVFFHTGAKFDVELLLLDQIIKTWPSSLKAGWDLYRTQLYLPTFPGDG